MDLENCCDMARDTLINFGVIVPFIICDLPEPNIGYCELRENKPKRILLHREFVRLNNAHIVMDVLLHEIAHALVGVRDPKDHHDEIWERKYREIGGKGDAVINEQIIVS